MPRQLDITIRELIAQSHTTAVDKGWWESGDRPVLEQLMLYVTEIAEAAEELRAGHTVGELYYDDTRLVTDQFGHQLPKPEGFLAEIADLFIRVGDTLGRYGLEDQFLTVLQNKMIYNKFRPYRHGGKTA